MGKGKVFLSKFGRKSWTGQEEKSLNIWHLFFFSDTCSRSTTGARIRPHVHNTNSQEIFNMEKHRRHVHTCICLFTLIFVLGSMHATALIGSPGMENESLSFLSILIYFFFFLGIHEYIACVHGRSLKSNWLLFSVADTVTILTSLIRIFQLMFHTSTYISSASVLL